MVGCGKRLRADNVYGYCQKHAYKNAAAKKRAARRRAKFTEDDRAKQRAAVLKHLADPDNLARHRARSAAWYEKHPESKRAATRNYRAKKTEAGGRVSVQDWLAVLEAYGHRCAWCASPGKLEMDHIWPVSLGGATTLQNVQPLCRSCNSSKGACVLGYRP